mgnify:CR=1 FL=1
MSDTPMSDAELAEMERADAVFNRIGDLLSPTAIDRRKLLAEVRRLREEPTYRIRQRQQEEIDDLRKRLAIYEPPEGERDETLVCKRCGSGEHLDTYPDKSQTNCLSCYQIHAAIPRWRYQLAHKILEGKCSQP